MKKNAPKPANRIKRIGLKCRNDTLIDLKIKKKNNNFKIIGIIAKI